MVCVYVLRSRKNGKRYVGISARLESRLRAHLRRTSKAGQQLGTFDLIHREEFPDYRAARTREKFLKSGQGRARLDAHFGSLASTGKAASPN